MHEYAMTGLLFYKRRKPGVAMVKQGRGEALTCSSQQQTCGHAATLRLDFLDPIDVQKHPLRRKAY